jgi:hypothetical protein
MESIIEKEALKFSQGQGAAASGLVDALKDARVKLAKNHTVEKALNIGTGDVDARVIGRILDKKGEKAVTGGLRTVGKFAEAFGPFSSPKAAGQSAPGVGYLRPWTPLLLGSVGMGATEYTSGHPYGIAAGMLPLLSGPARSMALSKMMQSAPSYSPSLTLRGANAAVPLAKKFLPATLSESLVQDRSQ